MATDRLGEQDSRLFRGALVNQEGQRFPGIFDPFLVRTSQPETLHLGGTQSSEYNPLMTRLAANGQQTTASTVDPANVLNFDFRSGRGAGGLQTTSIRADDRQQVTPSPSFLNPSPSNSHHEGLQHLQRPANVLEQGMRIVREERGQPVDAGRTELPRIEKEVVVLDSQRQVVRGPEFGQQQVTENRGKMRVIQSEITFSEVPKSVEEIQQQPQVVERVVEKPFEVLTYKPKTVIKNVDVPVTVIEENPIEKLVQREVYTHVQKITPVERHYEVPVERVVEVPVHRVLEREVHMQQIVEVPVEKVVDKIVEQRVQVPVYNDTLVQLDARSIPQHRNPNDIILPTKFEQREELEIVEQPEVIQQIREVVKEIPFDREIRREIYVDVPRTIEKPVQRVVYVDQYEDVVVEVPGQQIIQEQEVIVEKKTENYIQVPRDLFGEVRREKGFPGGDQQPNNLITDSGRRNPYTQQNYVPGRTQIEGIGSTANPGNTQVTYRQDHPQGGQQLYPGSSTTHSFGQQPGTVNYVPGSTTYPGQAQSQGTIHYQPGASTTLLPGQPHTTVYNTPGSGFPGQLGTTTHSTPGQLGGTSQYTPSQVGTTVKYYQGQPGQPQSQGQVQYRPGGAGTTTITTNPGLPSGGGTTIQQPTYIPQTAFGANGTTTITSPGIVYIPQQRLSGTTPHQYLPGGTQYLPGTSGAQYIPGSSGTQTTHYIPGSQATNYLPSTPGTQYLPHQHQPASPADTNTHNNTGNTTILHNNPNNNTNNGNNQENGTNNNGNNGRVWQIPIDRVIEETHIIPVEKTIERHIDHVINVPVERIVDIPVHVDNIVEKVVPVERIVHYPVKKIVEVPVFKEKIQEKQVFIERIEAEEVEKLVEKIIRKPVERIVEVPIEVTKYRPVIKKVEREEVIQLETQVRRDSEIEVLEMVEEEEDSELRSQVESLNRRVQDMEQENQQLRSQYERLERTGGNPNEGHTTTVQSYDYSSACNELQQRISSIQSQISEYEAKFTDGRLRN